MHNSVFALLMLTSAPVAASGGVAYPSPAQGCQIHISNMDRAAEATMKQGSPGMIVAIGKRGRQPIIKPYGVADIEQAAPVRAESVFRIASVTKQFTAAAVLALDETGELSIDDALMRHLPEFSASRDITLRHLLLHTSGIADYAQDEAGQVTRTVPHTVAQMLVWIGDLAKTPRFAPGTRWEYSNSNYVLLGAVVERVTGKPLGEVLKARLFDKANLRDTAFDVEADVVPHRVRGYKKLPSSPTGFANADPIDHSVPGAAGGLRSSMTDLLSWSEALFAGQVIDARSVQRMTTPGNLDDGRTTRWGMPPAWQAGLNADYAMGVFVSRTPHGERIWHDGSIDGFGTWLAHYPRHGITIALMQNSESADFDKAGIEAAVFAAQRDGCL